MPQRSNAQETRDRLLKAAIDVFGRVGFEGATTRMLTDAAGTNQQSIPYYFGGKEGLYLAAAEEIGSYMAGKFTLLQAEIAVLRSEPAPQPPEPKGKKDEAKTAKAERKQARRAWEARQTEARRLLVAMVRRLAQVHTDDGAEAACRIMMHEQAQPSAAYDRIHALAIGPLIDDLSWLMHWLSPPGTDDETLRLRAISLVGAVVIFLNSRPAVLRSLGWKELGPLESQVVANHAEMLVSLFCAAPESEG